MSVRLGETVIAGSLDINAVKQDIYNGIYPVNSIVFGFQAPGIPNGVNATWSDVSSSYNGRYFKVDSSNAVGTQQAEELPNIKGEAPLGSQTGFGSGGSGALGKRRDDVAMPYYVEKKEDTANHYLTFDASQSSGVYKDGGAVKPLTTTIKVWKRTA